jgi:hypothetical protein
MNRGRSVREFAIENFADCDAETTTLVVDNRVLGHWKGKLDQVSTDVLDTYSQLLAGVGDLLEVSLHVKG